jgi:hypothetical protein
MKQIDLGKLAVSALWSMLLMQPALALAAGNYQDDLWSLFVNWFPMIVLIGVWIYFMNNPKLKKTWTHQEEQNRLLEKIEQTLERIASAIEKK